MNTEDFEKLLRQQPPPALPPAWRAPILARATAAAPAAAHASLAAWLADLLWPTPKAWAGLAAIWGVLLLVNLGSFSAGRSPAPAPPAPGFALHTQQRLMAELLDLDESRKPAAPPARPAPRSERASRLSAG